MKNYLVGQQHRPVGDEKIGGAAFSIAERDTKNNYPK